MSHSPFPSVMGFILLALLSCLAGVFLLREYSNLKWKWAFLFSLVPAVMIFIWIRRGGLPHPASQGNLPYEAPWYFGVVSLFTGTAILGRLYQKWIAQDLTDEERLPGAAGFRAWLRASNLIMATVFAASTWLSFDIPFLTGLLLTLTVFAAFPLITTISSAEAAIEESPDDANTPPPIDTNAERDRVLRMLEEGKISPDDGAELLKAIGQSPAASPPALPARQQRFFLIGGLLILFGFLLPWFAIDLGKELSSAMRQFSVPNTPAVNTPIQYIKGGDIRHGLGWIILFAGLGTPAIWLFAPSIDRGTRRTISILALGVGGVLLLYLLTGAIRHLSFGFPIVIAGYVLLTIAVFRKSMANRSEALSPVSHPGT